MNQALKIKIKPNVKFSSFILDAKLCSPKNKKLWFKATHISVILSHLELF